ncbi:MAG TPA: TrkA C-terminal domain-containing protein [Halobacteriales archaeon]|nr:TrkA C-terminal domain-containing protein [Halobacteriales archaeon]
MTPLVPATRPSLVVVPQHLPGPAQLAPVGLAANAVQIVGLTVTAFLVGTLAAVTYRWYARSRIPEGLAMLAGLAAVTLYLNTDAALGQVIGGGVGLLDPEVVARNSVTLLLAAAAAVVGGRAGDRLAAQLGAVSGARELDVELSRLVRSVGRVITVTLPESADGIDDVEGYDPVAQETKETLAGKTLVFPRGLTVAVLRERLADRLKDDYGVGHVDVELAADGSVEYLAVGSRAAGIGPTLVPGTAATAVRADPPFSATSGDAVQVWSTDDGPRRVATGNLRAAAEDVVTLALDEVDAESLDPGPRYRLVTLPSQARPDREFASLLRRADETMGAVRIPEGSALDGATVGETAVSVVAVQPEDGTVEAIPRRDRPLAAGDVLYAVARPEALRRLEAAAAPVESAPAADEGSPEPEPS